jgi:hypothetical protein
MAVRKEQEDDTVDWKFLKCLEKGVWLAVEEEVEI